MGEERASTDLRAELLPGTSVCAEILCLDEQNKVRIAHVHHSSRNIAHVGQLDRAWHHPRNPHLALDQIKGVGNLNDVAGPEAAMCTQRDVLLPFTPRQPSGDAARPVAGEFRLATVSIEESQKKVAVRLTLQELDAVGTHARIPSTQLSRKVSMVALG